MIDANARKLDIAEVIEATMAAQSAHLDSIGGESILLIALLLYNKMLECNGGSLELEVDLSDLVSLQSFVLTIATNTEEATSKLWLSPKPNEVGMLRGN